MAVSAMLTNAKLQATGFLLNNHSTSITSHQFSIKSHMIKIVCIKPFVRYQIELYGDYYLE